MGLDVAIDHLYATGWSALDTQGCAHHADGRCFPTLERVKSEFASLGYEMAIRHVQLFDCYRAEWSTGEGPSGAVVGQSEPEAAVYALAQARRLAAAPA